MFHLARFVRTLRIGVVVLPVIVCVLAGCRAPFESRFQQHVNLLASDDWEGRGIGSPGLDASSTYIRNWFRQTGLAPGGDKGTYFQRFNMTMHRTLTDESYLTVEGDAEPLRQGVDFIPFNFSSDEAFEGEVLFCGYGIVAPEKDRDDFAGRDVEGAVVIIVRGEPPAWMDEDGRPTRYAAFREKVYNAKDRGAVAVLIVNQKPGEGEEDNLLEFVEQDAAEYGIPAFHIKRRVADALIAKVGGLAAHGFGSLQKLEEVLNTDKDALVALAGVKVSGKAGFKKIDEPTSNVVGVLRGEGYLADECVVIGAHYDHLGVKVPMLRKFKDGKLVHETLEPQIHNGADDNASGTSGLLEIARRFAAGPKPKRSIVFVAFTAEETGVHGSKYYVEHPTYPLEDTAAMLNMDMIGRLATDSNEIQVFGVKTGTEFEGILERAARRTGLTVRPTPGAGGGSDHLPFVRKAIPSLHFFTGIHEDYHKPSDDAEKINADGGDRIVSLVYRTAMKLANDKGRPTFQVVKRTSKVKTGDTPSYRVVMGLAPNYGEADLPGMGFDSVTPDGPADLAGMKVGDRIIRIGGKDIANIYDYMAATRGNKPGDTVEVVVLRDGEEVALQVTLAAAR